MANQASRVPTWIGCAFALCSAIVIFFTIPNFSDDIITEEDVRFRKYLEEAGYDTSGMGLKALLGNDAVEAQDAGTGDTGSNGEEKKV